MKSLKHIVAVLICLLFAAAPCMAEEVDLTRHGSLTITVHEADRTPVPGGTLTIYHVGTIPSASASVWDPTPEFAGANADLSKPQDRNVINYLVDYAHKHNIPSRTYEVPANATVTFDDIPLGLYLVEQQQAAPGYEAMAPFLISIPDTDDDGNYIYDVNAYPKSDPAKKHKPEKPAEPDTSARTDWQQWAGIALLALLFLFLLKKRKSA